MTADLVAFLRARLDEDERVATSAPGPRWYLRENRDHMPVSYYLVADDATISVDGWIDPAARWHMLSHDPARVLREVEAKRRIVEVCWADLLDRGGGATEGLVDRPTWDVLTALAAVYDQHPDYSEEWRP